MTEFESAAEIAELYRRIDRQRTTILELLAQRDAMTAERDHALLRMEVAVATSNGLLDAEVRRRTIGPLCPTCGHPSPSGNLPCDSCAETQADAAMDLFDAALKEIPASALRQQRQSIGLLSTADAGRVRLGGYAPSLPPR